MDSKTAPVIPVRSLPALIQRTAHINHVLLHAVIEPPQTVSDDLAAKMYVEIVNYPPASLERARDYLQTIHWPEADGLATHLNMQIGIIALSPLEAHDQYTELKHGQT